MKYCNHCGKEVVDEAEVCTACGCRVASAKDDKPIKGKGLGFVLSFFLGLIGLLVAIFLGDEDCKKMAIKTFVVCAIISIVIVILYVAVVCATLGAVAVY